MSKKNYPTEKREFNRVFEPVEEIGSTKIEDQPADYKSSTSAEREAEVAIIPRRNWRLINCKLADGRLVAVRVQNNKNYRPGMKLKVTMEVVGNMEVWRSAMQRDPRFHGKW